jgi:transposase
MSGDVPVRFCEGLEVKFLRSTHLKHKVSNAVSEALNSKIQMLKASARGFHNFESYRARILFYCGKLDMRIDAVPYY